MTILAYRLMVALRWSELESLKEKGTPLKINLQKLRKVREWPTCEVYDTPICELVGEDDGSKPRAFENGFERYRRSSDRKQKPDEDADIEVIVVRRKKGSSRKTRPDLRHCDIVELDEDDNEIGLSDGKPVVAQEEPSPSGADDFVITDDPLWKKYHVEPTSSRRYKRAVKNNEYIESKLKPLRLRREQLRARLKSLGDGPLRDSLKTTIASVEKGIYNLKTQVSDLSVCSLESVGGAAIPPPERYCTRCKSDTVCKHDRPHSSRGSLRGGHAGRESAGANPGRDRDGPKVRASIDRSNGMYRFNCWQCEASLAWGRACHTPGCGMYNVPVRYPFSPRQGLYFGRKPYYDYVRH